jgi:hypothetical protein
MTRENSAVEWVVDEPEDRAPSQSRTAAMDMFNAGEIAKAMPILEAEGRAMADFDLAQIWWAKGMAVRGKIGAASMCLDEDLKTACEKAGYSTILQTFT